MSDEQDSELGSSPRPSDSLRAGPADELSGFFTPLWSSQRGGQASGREIPEAGARGRSVKMPMPANWRGRRAVKRERSPLALPQLERQEEPSQPAPPERPRPLAEARATEAPKPIEQRRRQLEADGPATPVTASGGELGSAAAALRGGGLSVAGGPARETKDSSRARATSRREADRAEAQDAVSALESLEQRAPTTSAAQAASPAPSRMRLMRQLRRTFSLATQVARR